jgi:hypothetical protein
MKRIFELGGIAASMVLIGFGIAAIVIGVNGRSTVHTSLMAEQIVGTPDMTPAAIKAEAAKAGLPASIALPTVDVAGKPINNGERARAFASYMRIHALEATGGLTYSQTPRYATADGKGTNDPNAAQKGATGRPLDNAVRNVWVTETALSTALNTSYMAERLSVFGIVVGIALLLSGIGFLVLTLGGALRSRTGAAVAKVAHRSQPAVA